MKTLTREDLHFQNSFVVMPADCNYMYPLIFGGAFMSQLDLCAASLVRRIIANSVCDNAVTHKANFEFIGPSFAGDLINMRAEITELKGKHICIEVRAEREYNVRDKVTMEQTVVRTPVAVATFVFVTRVEDIYTRHNLVMPQNASVEDQIGRGILHPL